MTPQPQRDRDRDRDRERGRQQAEEPTTGKAITGTHHTPYTFVPHTEYLDNDTHSGNRQYHLVVRQQPERARACGYADRADRRPLDPPPVAQLHVTDRRTGQVYADTLHNPYYMCYATLYHATLDHEILPSTSPTSPQSHPLNGTVVTSMARLKDENHVDGAYFVFCNLGVKAEGRYRVLFTLFEISGGAVHCRARTLTEPFYVYGKSFPGMAESTPLCRCFAEQGVRLRVRNEPKLRRKVVKRKGEDRESIPPLPSQSSQALSMSSSTPKPVAAHSHHSSAPLSMSASAPPLSIPPPLSHHHPYSDKDSRPPPKRIHLDPWPHPHHHHTQHDPHHPQQRHHQPYTVAAGAERIESYPVSSTSSTRGRISIDMVVNQRRSPSPPPPHHVGSYHDTPRKDLETGYRGEYRDGYRDYPPPPPAPTRGDYRDYPPPHHLRGGGEYSHHPPSQRDYNPRDYPPRDYPPREYHPQSYSSGHPPPPLPPPSHHHHSSPPSSVSSSRYDQRYYPHPPPPPGAGGGDYRGDYRPDGYSREGYRDEYKRGAQRDWY